MSDKGHLIALRTTVSEIREKLEQAGMDITAEQLIDEGSWGRVDLSVANTSRAGKVQVHCNTKGRISVVPQGPLTESIRSLLSGTPVTTPTRFTNAIASKSVATGTVKIPPGTVVVDCSKTGQHLIGPTEWRGMIALDDGAWSECFHSPLFPRGHNNVGEFLAILDALRLVHAGTISASKIYTDSRTALSWVRNRKIKSKFDAATEFDPAFCKVLGESVAWMESAAFRTLSQAVHHWPTSQWGDIPADFQRK